MHMMRFGYFGGPGPGNGVGFFFFILLIVFFGAVLCLLLSSTHRRNLHGHSSFAPHPHGPHPEHHGGQDLEARRILDRRFASGEIDEEEYLRRRKLLEGDS
jgi:putative membrane protein